MSRESALLKDLTDMVKETKSGKLHWKVECQSTEYNPPEEKPKVTDEDTTWTVDECYVSYYCQYKGKEFFMISYEMIHTAGEQVKTTNLIFLPPLGIRLFDVKTLASYAIEASQMLVYEVHMLFLNLLEVHKAHPDWVEFDASPRTLTIE